MLGFRVKGLGSRVSAPGIAICAPRTTPRAPSAPHGRVGARARCGTPPAIRV